MEKIEGFVKQSWGYEIIWVNNDKYCAKIMVFEKVGSKVNLHFHKEKQKSWFVNNGKFLLRYIDTTTAKMHEKILNEGETFHVLPLVPHQIESMGQNATIFEVSTPEIPNDLYQLFSSNKD